MFSKFFAWLGSLFNLSTNVKFAVGTFLIIFVLGIALNKCHAEVDDAPYIQVDAGSTIVRGVAPVIDFTLTEPAPQLTGAFFQESLTVIGSSRFDGHNVPNNYLIRALFVDGFGHFDTGLGLCYVDNPSPYNGQSLNFNLQLDYRFTTWPITLTYTHCSDAGTRLPNLGRDLVMVGWRFH